MPKDSIKKRRTYLTLNDANLTSAHELGLNVSAISDAALAEAVSAARAEIWARKNADALAERRVWIENNGTPLAALQSLRVD